MKSRVIPVLLIFFASLPLFTSCGEKEPSTPSSSLIGTQWEYTQIDTLSADDGTLAYLIDKMTLQFITDNQGKYSMDYSLIVDNVEDFSDRETYNTQYSFDETSLTGHVKVVDEANATLYNFNLELRLPDTLNVNIMGSNPMPFIKVR